MSMFDFVHNNKRIVQVILGVVALSFVLFLGEQNFNFLGEDPLAKFKGGEISLAEFNREYSPLSTQSAEGEAPVVDTLETREDYLNTMIEKNLVFNQLDKYRISISNSQIQAILIEELGENITENGVFSPEKYRRFMETQRIDPVQFENYIRAQLGLSLIPGGIYTSTIMSKALAEKMLSYDFQQRTADRFSIPSRPFSSTVTVSEDDIKTFYQKNLDQFQIPEEIKVAYILLPVQTIGADIPVTEEEIAQYYEKNKNNFSQVETRESRHILISVPENADEATEKEAKNQIDQLLAQVRKNPERFSDLAIQYSNDPGTAAEGGALGELTPDVLVEPFSTALFNLKLNEISDVVRTPYGYHIIILDKIHPGGTVPLALLKDDIENRLRNEKAARVRQERVDDFSDYVYGASSSLEPVAKEFGLKIEESDWLTADTIITDPVLSKGKLARVLFDGDFIQKGLNTEPIEIDEGFVSARIIGHRPKKAMPLEEIRPMVIEMVKTEKINQKAQEEGERLIAALRKDSNYAVQWEPLGAIGQFGGEQELERAEIKAIRTADIASLPENPAYTGVLTENGFSVFRITQVEELPMDPTQREMMASIHRLTFQRAMAEDLVSAYYDALWARSNVRINKDLLKPESPSRRMED